MSWCGRFLVSCPAFTHTNRHTFYCMYGKRVCLQRFSCSESRRGCVRIQRCVMHYTGVVQRPFLWVGVWGGIPLFCLSVQGFKCYWYKKGGRERRRSLSSSGGEDECGRSVESVVGLLGWLAGAVSCRGTELGPFEVWVRWYIPLFAAALCRLLLYYVLLHFRRLWRVSRGRRCGLCLVAFLSCVEDQQQALVHCPRNR